MRLGFGIMKEMYLEIGSNMQCSPNPVTDILTVFFKLPHERQVQFEVIDIPVRQFFIWRNTMLKSVRTLDTLISQFYLPGNISYG